MKLLTKIIAASALILAVVAHAQTPVYYNGFLAPGVPQTNPLVFTAWPLPPAGNNWVQVGSNTVYVGTPQTNTPGTNGYFTTTLWPTLYKVAIPALGPSTYFYANVLSTTNTNSIGFYGTNIVVANNVASSAQVIAAMLGYTPAPNTYAGVTAALGFTPATNAGPIAYSQLPYTPPTNSYTGLTNVLGFVPATNGGPLAYAQLPYTPPTNSYTGLTNVLGFVPATNGGALAYAQLPFTPPTNSYSALTNVLGFVPATNGGALAYAQLPFTPPTNSYTGLTYALGFAPATNVAGITTNIVFLDINTNQGTLYVTNSQILKVNTP